MPTNTAPALADPDKCLAYIVERAANRQRARADSRAAFALSLCLTAAFFVAIVFIS